MDNQMRDKNNMIIYATDDGKAKVEVFLEEENSVVKENLTTARD